MDLVVGIKSFMEGSILNLTLLKRFSRTHSQPLHILDFLFLLCAYSWYLYIFLHVDCWLHPRISMPCLMHLGLHCWFRCCTGALQGRCTYSAHTRPDTFCAFNSIRSAWCLLVAVRALYRSAVRTAPNWFPRGTEFWRCTKALFVQRPFVPSWDSVLALYRRCS